MTVMSQLATWNGTNFVPLSTASDPHPLSFGSSFIIAPGNYLYNGQTFAVPEGLVSFFAIDPSVNYNDGGFRYAYAGDVDKLIRGLAFMFETGNRDNGLSVASAETTMRLRKLGMTCGNTCAVVRDLFAKPIVNIPTRNVHFLTDQTPNNFDDGHQAVEVYIGGKWVFVDFDLKNRFIKSDGSYASLLDIVDLGVENLTVEVLSPHTFYSDDWSASNERYAIYNWQTWATDEQKAAWRERIYRIPAIDGPSGPVAFLPTGTEGRASYVTGLGYALESRASFIAQFYS